jgi:hypothetical protein
MVRYEYQTCLRMSNTLKDDMTDICDEYNIDEFDLMRKAIVPQIKHAQKTSQTLC